MTAESPLAPTLTSLRAPTLLMFVWESCWSQTRCKMCLIGVKNANKTAAAAITRSAAASYPLSLQRDVAKVIKEGCSRARWPLLWPEAVWRDKWLTQPGVRLGLMPLSAPLLSQWFSQISDRVCYLVTGMRATACRHREGQSMRTIFVGLNEKKELTKKRIKSSC